MVKCCPTYHIFTSGRRVWGDREPWMPREVFGLPSILPLPRVYPPLTSHFPPHYQHPPTHLTNLAVSSRLYLFRFFIEYVASSHPSLLPRLPHCLVRTLMVTLMWNYMIKSWSGKESITWFSFETLNLLSSSAAAARWARLESWRTGSAASTWAPSIGNGPKSWSTLASRWLFWSFLWNLPPGY